MQSKRMRLEAIEGKRNLCYCGQVLQPVHGPGMPSASAHAQPLQEVVCQRRASSRASTRSKTSRRSSTCGSHRSTPWCAVVSSRRSSSEGGGSGGSIAFSSTTTSNECTRRHANGRSRIRSPGVRKKRDHRDRCQGQEAPSGERRLTTSLPQVVLGDFEMVVPDDLDRSRRLVAIGELQSDWLPTTGKLASGKNEAVPGRRREQAEGLLLDREAHRDRRTQANQVLGAARPVPDDEEVRVAGDQRAAEPPRASLYGNLAANPPSQGLPEQCLGSLSAQGSHCLLFRFATEARLELGFEFFEEAANGW